MDDYRIAVTVDDAKLDDVQIMTSTRRFIQSIRCFGGELWVVGRVFASWKRERNVVSLVSVLS